MISNQKMNADAFFFFNTGGGGGSSVTVEPLSVTANDTYTAPSGKAYSPVVVDVPDTPAVVNRLEVTKNGNYDAPAGTDGFNPVVVNVPTGGGGSGSLADQVRFFDYDGTLVDSYSKADFNALSAMPSNPSHTGLTAQGWNWTLQEAKTYLADNPDSIVNIGQMYITSDGKTRIYIHIDEDCPSSRRNFFVRFKSSVANNVSLDWDDGTVETKGSTTVTNYEHTYASGGDYVIKLTVNSGTIAFNGTEDYAIYGSTDTDNTYNSGRIYRVEIGDNVITIGNYAFYQCYSLANITIPSGVLDINLHAFEFCYTLKSVTVPSTVTNIMNYAFYYCYSLESAVIPSSVTTIGTYNFEYCYSLKNITIPSGVTTISNYTFAYCYSLERFTIPSSVTTIGSNAFSTCYSLKSITIPSSVTTIVGNTFFNAKNLTSITIPSGVTSIGSFTFASCCGVGEYHIKPTTPPTLANANAFQNIQSDCVMYVPYSADHSVLNAYKGASNWSTYASKMVEEAE